MAGKSQATAANRAPKPCALHGSWLPAESGGQFVVWGEQARTPRRSRGPLHPFCLAKQPLERAILDAWVPAAGNPGPSTERTQVWITAPAVGRRPSPSVELLADLGSDPPTPDAWGHWRVAAVRVSDPLALLERLPERDILGDRTIRIGHDLRFWAHLLAALEQAVRRHEYLPSMFAAQFDGFTVRGNRRKKPKIEFGHSWELADSARERIARSFERGMPLSCRALSAEEPDAPEGRAAIPAARSLAEHFLHVQLQAIVARTKHTQKLLQAFDGTYPSHGLSKSSSHISLPPITQATWEQWWQWHRRIQRASAEVDEQVCFRLADTPHDSPDDWRLQWLLSSRRDPSLLVPLEQFWKSDRDQRPKRLVREVLLQLGQAARLYDRLWEGMASEAPSELVLRREEALDFLRLQAPILQGAGFRVIVPAWWTSAGQRRLRLRLTPQSSLTGGVGAEPTGLLGINHLVKFKAEVVLDGTPLTREEWARVVEAKQGLVEVRGQWMELQPAEVGRLEEFWQKGQELVTMTVRETLQAAATESGPEIVHEGELGDLLAGLSGSGALEQLPQPRHFQGALRPYQMRGYSWLAYLERIGCGACLADDMGLGKTIQVIAAILGDRSRDPDGGPTLLVAPTSVLGNWQREVRRFAPTLIPYVHHGPKRPKTPAPFKKAVAGADIVVVSFAGARLDVNVLTKVAWRRLVVDECQNAKNPSAAVTKALRRIRAESRIALTGTPVENRLMDLWSLFSIINPGYLGTMTAFRKNVERPIMRHRDAEVASALRKMVRPFILRRMKTDKRIISDLPGKVEQNALCNLTPEQASLYEAVVRDVEQRLKQSKVDGIKRAGLVLSTLTRLKQICNHPAQFLQDGSAFSASRSHKLARVCAMLDEIEAEGESALVFTQFREVGKQLRSLFRKRYGGPVYYLHGGTPRARREHMVEEFQDPNTERGIFVLSLRAGGVGINLTRANHVIHFDRWWNPAVENQATDRAYRIGQEKCVMVHKMITMGTLEERIDEVIESKRELAEEIVGSGESWLSKLDNATFRRLISLDRGDAVIG